MNSWRVAINGGFKALVFIGALAGGCGRQPDVSTSAVTQPPEAALAEPAIEPSAFSAVNDSLKAGAVDEAAARLFNMRASRSGFSQADAAAYRTALEEVYSRALEASQKGDPRAEAALKMLRAATAR